MNNRKLITTESDERKIFILRIGYLKGACHGDRLITSQFGLEFITVNDSRRLISLVRDGNGGEIYLAARERINRPPYLGEPKVIDRRRKGSLVYEKWDNMIRKTKWRLNIEYEN